MDFAGVFIAALKSKGWSQNGAGPRLGVSGPYVNQIVKKARKPPLELVESWAVTLGLTDEDRQRFVRLAQLEHTPEPLRAELEVLRRQLSDCQAQLREGDVGTLALEVKALRAEVAELRRRAVQPQREVRREGVETRDLAERFRSGHARNDTAPDELGRMLNPDEHPQENPPSYPRPDSVSRKPTRGG